MYIQGHLQIVFDALYAVGAIDPVLKMDWSPLHKKMQADPEPLKRALKEINGCGGDLNSMMFVMKTWDQDVVNFVALEVARELAEFTDRKTLH